MRVRPPQCGEGGRLMKLTFASASADYSGPREPSAVRSTSHPRRGRPGSPMVIRVRCRRFLGRRAGTSRATPTPRTPDRYPSEDAPVSIRRCSGAPRLATSRSITWTTSSASHVRSTRIANASRVCSSTILSSFSLLWSAVSSNWKSSAQTWFGRSARNSSPVGPRRRLRLRAAGRRRPSSRHKR